MSAESGIPTFRDANGLWEGHDVTRVASPQGWADDPQLVLDFYNLRRQAVRAAEPNAAHRFLVELEERYNVVIVTQNVDDLHERAGSQLVLHLHGEIRKARSTGPNARIYELGDDDIEFGDLCDDGYQLRPHIVWFGEVVSEMQPAAELVAKADILLVIGTSLVVYPAASLVDMAEKAQYLIVVDPNARNMRAHPEQIVMPVTACDAVEDLRAMLIHDKL